MNDYMMYLAQQTFSGAIPRRDFLGRCAALGVSAAAASTLLGTVAKAAVQGGTLKMGLGGGASTDSLDPALSPSSVPYQVIRTYGDLLFEVNVDGSLNPRLAESFESSPDAKTWSFAIRQGVVFHNGKTLTAEDVLQTLLRHSDKESKSGALGLMQGISRMHVDGTSLVITLNDANTDLPYLLSDRHLLIQPNGGRDDPTAGIGTGPYKLVKAAAGEQYHFERFANYWDRSRGHVAAVEISVINDDTARNAALQSGQVHVVNKILPKVAVLLNRTPGLSVKKVSGSAQYVFIMQCDVAPFNNRDLRNALKYAINREQMVDKILRGYGSVGNDFPINGVYPLFDDTIPQRPHDPEKAAALYKASGHDGSPIVLHVAETAFPGAVDAAQLFQQDAKAAGIPLQIKREPNDGYWSDVWNKKPFVTSFWDPRPVQDLMYSIAYLSGVEWNDTHFSNAQFDSLLMQARGELDQAKRKKLYSKMAIILRDEGGLICPMFRDLIAGVRDTVQGWEENGRSELMDGLMPAKCWLS